MSQQQSPASDIDGAIDEVAAAVHSVDAPTLDAVAADIAAAKVIATYAGAAKVW